MTTLIELLRIESQEMVNEFKKASIKGKGTPQEVADFREIYFQNFLRKYFPFPYRVTKGGIIDSFGQKSASIDCVLLNPAHPFTIDEGEKFSVILADGVDCAIEIKPNIADKDELERALQQIVSVKKLRRAKTPIVMTSKASTNIMQHSLTTPSFIFSLKAKSNIIDTINEIINYYEDNNVPLIEQVDYIVINGYGIIANYKYPELYLRPRAQGYKYYGYFYETWEDLTLAIFLLYINTSFAALPLMATTVLERYLRNIKPKQLQRHDYEGFWE